MSLLPTLYALLRDGVDWLGERTHLDVQPDGALALARLPGLDPAVSLPGPYAEPLSGLALDGCGMVYRATAAGQVLRLDGPCDSRLVLPAIAYPTGHPASGAPGQFVRPRGLLLTGSSLLVADSGNGRIQVLRLPGMEVIGLWQIGLIEPSVLAAAPAGRVYVLDTGPGQVLRLLPGGAPDGAYPPVAAAGAFAMAAAPDGRLYLSFPTQGRVAVIGPDGLPLVDLISGGPAAPGALALVGELLFVADQAEGDLWVYDLLANTYAGRLAGYRGLVSAMATGPDGRLLIASAADEDAQLVTLAAGAGTYSSGMLQAGPLDAGDIASWVRVHVTADLQNGGEVRLSYYAGSNQAHIPTGSDWLAAPAGDFLLQSPATSLENPGLRYLWLRVELAGGAQAGPRLWQVQAQTAGEDWMDYLPAVYRRTDDTQGDYFRRWLALLQSELGDLEAAFELLPYRFNPASAPLDELPWLAGWMGFELPPGLPPAAQRDLLARLARLYHRRGTRPGLEEWIELYTGVRPQIIEDFRERHLWILGETSLLGLETGLAPALPNGMIVPERTPADACVTQAAGPAAVDDTTPRAWSSPPGLVVGELVVGQIAPLAVEQAGEPLFSETAHRFTVLVPAASVPDEAARRWLAQVIEAEKPAHTDYRLCFIEANLRVGFQARIGVDTILAGPPGAAALGEAALSKDMHLGGSPDGGAGSSGPGRAGQSRIGQDLVLAAQ